MNNSSIFDIEPKNGKNRFLVLPSICYFDTSFILCALDNSGDKQSTSLCRGFITQMSDAGSILVISPVVIEEITHVLRQKCVKQATGLSVMSPDEISKYIVKNPSILLTIEKKVQEIRSRIESIFLSLDYMNGSSFLDNVIKAMTQYGLDTQDARHIAICVCEDINCLATVDGDYQRTDGFNIYTPNKKTIQASISRSNVFIAPSSTNTRPINSSKTTT